MIAWTDVLPLIPDGDEARSWAERELADPAYEIAEPTAFDRFARDVAEFVAGLFSGGPPAGIGPWLALAAIAIVAAAVIVALVVWGRPRSAARSRRALPLFGETDERSAADLRDAADAAAAANSWDAAIVLRFRALARDLVERTIIDPAPGATVHGFAREAAQAYPAESAALDHAADRFDEVRYLRRPGSAAVYEGIAALDQRLMATAPVLTEPPSSVVLT